MKPAICIMDRFSAQDYSAQNNAQTSVIISITDKLAPENEFADRCDNGIRAILRLKFDDVDSGKSAITEVDAANIAQFIKDWQDKVDLIVVHCEAGISRSAGVAAAIMKCLHGSDDLIFDSYRYSPNIKCYRAVLDALKN
jgi:predicted protein tyrosine phosphatase